MVFVGVQFGEDDGGSIAVVSDVWLTPLKAEVFWPPFKKQEQYYKALKASELPNECTWGLYKISRRLFEVEDYDKALAKLKLAEVTSDLQSEVEDKEENRSKRRRIAKRLYSSSDEEQLQSAYERPPAVKRANSFLPNRDSRMTFVGPTISRNLTSTITNSTTSAIINNDAERTLSNNYNERQSLLTHTPSTSGIFRRSNFEKNEQQSQSPSGRMIILLQQIKEQNNEILKYLKKQEVSTNSSVNLPDIPVSLPVGNEHELSVLEHFLGDKDNSFALTSYFATLGGRDITSMTNNILKRCLTNQLACKFSYRGKGTKKAFVDLSLKNVVIGAVKQKNSQSSERDIEDHVKVWLKHSPQRFKVDCAKGRIQI